jgi:hypothetical protein
MERQEEQYIQHPQIQIPHSQINRDNYLFYPGLLLLEGLDRSDN